MGKPYRFGSRWQQHVGPRQLDEANACVADEDSADLAQFVDEGHAQSPATRVAVPADFRFCPACDAARSCFVFSDGKQTVRAIPPACHRRRTDDIFSTDRPYGVTAQ
jgi:hypothetical protein